LVEEVAIEGAKGEDFGVPVVEGCSAALGEFAGWVLVCISGYVEMGRGYL